MQKHLQNKTVISGEEQNFNKQMVDWNCHTFSIF